MSDEKPKTKNDPRNAPPCPNCGKTMWGMGCKLRCQRCGYMTDCGEGEVNLKTGDS